MFDLKKIGVFYNINRPYYKGIAKINSIGMESMRFIKPDFVNNSFKKVHVIVLIQEGNFVVTEDGILPHALVNEVDLESAAHHPTTTAIVEAAARRAALNAGVTIAKNSLQLFAVAENDHVYYLYTSFIGRKLHDDIEMTRITSLTDEAFLNQCSLSNII
jgi:hypothetical protein